MKQEIAKQLLEKTKRDYNIISEEFANTRQYIWDDLKESLSLVQKGDKILDYGCGSGRLYEPISEKGAEYTGVDVSEKLIEIAKKKYSAADFRIIAPDFKLPFENNFFDFIFAVAILHHIPSANFRQKSLTELKRVLKPGGKIIILSWYLWKRRYLKYLIRQIIKKIFFMSKLDFFDAYIPWRNSKGKILANRYVHAFRKSELETLTKNAGFKNIEINESGYNIVLIGENIDKK